MKALISSATLVRQPIGVLAKNGSVYFNGINKQGLQTLYYLSSARNRIEPSGYDSLEQAAERENGKFVYEGDTVTLQF